jgi:hypothetical protein
MKIYICHSSSFDYKKERYEPIRRSELNNKYEFILPHEISDKIFNDRSAVESVKNLFQVSEWVVKYDTIIDVKVQN